MRSGKNVWAKGENADMDKLKQRIAMMINNTLRIGIFGVLAVVFNHWWIILFSALFLIYEKDN